jgi:hypothetical protein
MYEVFDDFLSIDTWHTMHPSDENRFFKALDKIVRDPRFAPETMRDYFNNAKDLNQLPEDHVYRQAVDHYVSMACAVKSYLEAIT